MKHLKIASLSVIMLMPSVVAAQPATQIYKQHCSTCHSSGIAGAPRKGSKYGWQSRLEAAGSIEQLVVSAKKGRRSMPPKGLCVSCSDTELRAAIEFMMQ
ncbi:cytochrome c5 family protein [Pelagibaculum spongiae]|uniref:Cytochrome c5 family protein n=2 Tax=Pelagibaculum spongiae TaxID=2080658 RepID=A0A2V1GYT6_9GAMM|nr:cytochrome c5 family protein [Pelagibaculum spongiae]